MKSMNLVCNSHLDPIWLWEWEEGAAEAISTFRAAADFCEECDGFIFNHNEVILYQWIEEYDEVLFKRIQKLVRQKKWHIMGGWYLQPDCNMPSGESFVRQILLGRKYFNDKFGVRPTTAINFDSFGHSRGMVQILAKSGFDSYIFCRPTVNASPLKSDIFVWEGYDGSQITAVRCGFYRTIGGAAAEKLNIVLKEQEDVPHAIMLWGVGNHGGGPSRKDIKDINRLISANKHIEICHSTPEAYFKKLDRSTLPVHKADHNPWAVGCYTSQMRIKKGHRCLENALYMTEKMISAAWGQGLIKYPEQELRDAGQDLATIQFHDILPGTSIQPAEEAALRMTNHGSEILARLKTRAFFALARGQRRAKKGEYPIFVYNPHPYPIRQTIECEFNLEDRIYDDIFIDIAVNQAGKKLSAQVEQEHSNVPFEWRKRVVFSAELAPSQMSRFDCFAVPLPSKPKYRTTQKNGQIRFKTKEIEVVINTKTGLVDRYQVGGIDHVLKGAFKPIIMRDNEDPWELRSNKFRNKEGTFKLLSQKEAARMAGLDTASSSKEGRSVGKLLSPVRVIEDGSVRCVIECLFGYGDSRICQRYKLPREGSSFEVETRVYWMEKDRMLKLSIPTLDKEAICMGQVAYGTDVLRSDGDEIVAQRWVAAVSKKRQTALTVINDSVYGLDCCEGELRISLLRAPAYSGHPIEERVILAQDRFIPRIDQGEHVFGFEINGDSDDKRLKTIDREALVFGEKPMALSFFPSSNGAKAKQFITLSDDVVQVSATKKAENGNSLIIRLFEPTGHTRNTTLSLPFVGMKKKITLKKFEIRTYAVNIRKKTWKRVTLEERSCG